MDNPNITPPPPRGRSRIFRMPDGKVMYAFTFEELALKMRESAFFPAKDLNEYMLDVAKRVFIMHGIHIVAWAPEPFIRDLIHFKIVTEILHN